MATIIKLTSLDALDNEIPVLVNADSISYAYQDGSTPNTNTVVILSGGGNPIKVKESIETIETLLKNQKS